MKRFLTSLSLLAALALPAWAQAPGPIRVGIALSQTGNLADSSSLYCNYEPGYSSSFGYNAVFVLEAAVKRAGSLDQDALRNVERLFLGQIPEELEALAGEAVA